MVRPRTINRENLLAIAEEIVFESGPSALTFGGLATASGVSKASVQSVFGTREALIDAMLEHWLDQEQQRFREIAGDNPSQAESIRAHLQTTEQSSEVASSRMAAVLATLKGSDTQSTSAARWYTSRIGDLSAATPEQKRLRIAFLAAEGAFFLRFLAGVPMTKKLWREIFEDLRVFQGD